MAFVDLPRKDAIVQHATKRLFEHHGLTITVAELRELSGKCAAGKFPAKAPGRTGGDLHRVRFHDRELWAIFRRQDGLIVTFLPGAPEEVREAG